MRVLIAGGGTGGHLYPGMAIAEEVTSRPGGEVLFVGTERGLEARVVPAAGYPLELLQVSGLKRMGLAGTLRGLGRLPVAFGRSLAIVRRFRPDVVLGVGGYASGPLVLAAALSGRPTAIQEQNSVPGFTNRTLGRFAKACFTAFPQAEAAFPRGKAVPTGNPVRRAFVARAARLEADPAPGRVTHGPGRLLVVGGSQGARAVNDLVLGAVELWARRGGAMPAVVHQTGPADAERVSVAYARLGLAPDAAPVEAAASAGGPSIPHRLRPPQVRPFIEDMAAAYAACDLVIARAGALTLAELAILGKPAVLIPLPTAADDHQTRNAQAFADAGAARLLPQSGATGAELAAIVQDLIDDPPALAEMARAMRAQARPSAAKEIVDHLEALQGRQRGRLRGAPTG